MGEFIEPTEEQVNSFIDKHKIKLEQAGFLTGAILVLIALILSTIAFFMVKNYTAGNIGILLVLLSVIIFFTWKFIGTLNNGLNKLKATVKRVTNITNTYESLVPEEKGSKIKLEIFYEFKDHENNIKAAEFIVLFDKDKLDEIKSEIPVVGSKIPIIYNSQNAKIVQIFIPKLTPYIEEF